MALSEPFGAPLPAVPALVHADPRCASTTGDGGALPAALTAQRLAVSRVSPSRAPVSPHQRRPRPASLCIQRDTVYDAACGTGTFACLLAPVVEFILACDYSEKMLEQARRKAARRGLRNIAFRVRDLRSLKLPRQVFDAAVCANVLHLLDSPEDAVAQLKGVVRPGGLIIVANYVHETGADSGRMELISRFGFEFAQDWDAAALEEFLSEQGLRIIDKSLFDAWQPLEVVVCRAVDDVV